MENMRPNCCPTMEGSLPGKCANMVFPYVPMQCDSPERYDAQEGLAAGTLFPGLNLPFFKAIRSRMNCDNRALCELMALDFAITELALYLCLAYRPMPSDLHTAYTWLSKCRMKK